jgi:molybdopterin adenylyltransferase
MKPLRIGRITASDRAYQGIYEDVSGPELEKQVNALFPDRSRLWHRLILPDDQEQIQKALLNLVDREHCHLVVTTGGTGPARRDVTPEATRYVIEKELPGFGEILRVKSYELASTSIMSRATAGICRGCLVVNLPGRPNAIAEGLAILGIAIQKTLSIIEADSSTAEISPPHAR